MGTSGLPDMENYKTRNGMERNGTESIGADAS